jgi:hypothetical protein
VVLRPCRVYCLSPGKLFLPGRVVLVPCFIRAIAGGALPSRSLFSFRRTIPQAVFLRIVDTYYCCLALGSYMAIFLALEALLQATLSFIPLALKQLALLD